jgi:anthranilate phosphoribosyltransferase
MEEMTSKQISALIAWLEAKGMTPEEILDCLKQINE